MSLERFAPIKVERCKDIQKELKKAAAENKLQTEDLWFEILKLLFLSKTALKTILARLLVGNCNN